MAMFSVPKEKKSVAHLIPLFLLIAVLILFVYATANLSDTNETREQEIVTTALNRSITQCYALEGTYPPSLSYLQQHYGFTYNTNHFFIDYQYIGGNLRPDVTIIRRESEN
jgi:hypothetical protein